MRFAESREGDYRIYAGALEAPGGEGYTAALVVSRVACRVAAGGGPGIADAADAAPSREAYRDDSMACGHRWRSAEEALRYALVRARELIRSRSPMLIC